MQKEHDIKTPPGDTATEPVCAMTVEKARAAATSTLAGTTCYFCNPRCKELFNADPSKYLKEATREAAPQRASEVAGDAGRDGGAK